MKKKSLQLILGALIMAGSFYFVKSVQADTSCGGSGDPYIYPEETDYWVGQTFNASSSIDQINISGCGNGAGTTTFVLHICSGDLTYTDADKDCSGYSQIQYLATTTQMTTADCPTFSQEYFQNLNLVNCYKPDDHEYIWFTVEATDRAYSFNGIEGGAVGNCADTGVKSLNTTFDDTHDLTFSVADGTYQPNCTTWYDTELFTDYGYYLETVRNYTCIYDAAEVVEDGGCYFWFAFDEESVANKVHFVIDDTGIQDPAHSIASTTVTGFADSPNQQNAIVLPITGSWASSFEFQACLYLEDIAPAQMGDQLGPCGINVRYISQAQFSAWADQAISDALKDELEADPCEGVASSSGDFFDDFRYGVECGFQRVIKWAFYPSDEALRSIFENIEKLSSSFPQNIFLDTYAAFEAGTATSTGIELVPIIKPDGASTTVIGYLIDQDDIETATMYPVIQSIRPYLVTFLYFLAGLYFLLRIWMMGRKVEE